MATIAHIDKNTVLIVPPSLWIVVGFVVLAIDENVSPTRSSSLLMVLGIFFPEISRFPPWCNYRSVVARFQVSLQFLLPKVNGSHNRIEECPFWDRVVVGVSMRNQLTATLIHGGVMTALIGVVRQSHEGNRGLSGVVRDPFLMPFDQLLIRQKRIPDGALKKRADRSFGLSAQILCQRNHYFISSIFLVSV
jgi:hypothetical protein